MDRQKSFIDPKTAALHLGLWQTRNHDPSQFDDAHTPTIEIELTYGVTYSQLPPLIIGPNKGLING